MSPISDDKLKQIVQHSMETRIKGRPIAYVDAHGVVVLMAVVKGHAMVRRPGCSPYCISIAELGIRRHECMKPAEVSP